jgi:hypothetical protein
MNALELYHKWMKEWGSDIGEHEREVVADINAYEKWLMESLHLEVEMEDAIRRRAKDDALEEAARILEVRTERGMGLAATVVRALKSKP